MCPLMTQSLDKYTEIIIAEGRIVTFSTSWWFGVCSRPQAFARAGVFLLH